MLMGISVSTAIRLLKDLKLEMPCDPAASFLGVCLQELKPALSRVICCGAIHNSQEIEPAEVPINTQLGKGNVFMCPEVLFYHKEQNHTLCREVDGTRGHRVKQNKTHSAG